MRRKLPLFSLLIVLILIASGCLPSVPKKILGPTWPSQYRIPLVRAKKINLGSEGEDGLGLEKVSLNYRSSYEEGDEPLTLEIFEERVTVDPGNIPVLSFSGELPSEGEYELPKDDQTKKIDFSFEGLGEYAEIKLSSEETFHNYIGVSLTGAVAGAQGLDIVLYANGAEVNKVSIPTGGSYGQLKIPGLTISSESKFTIEATGSIFIEQGASSPCLKFDPGEMEIEEFTVEDFGPIKDDLNLGSLEIEALKLREDDTDFFELQLKEAVFSFTPVLPEGLTIKADLTVEALDRWEQPIEDQSWKINNIELKKGKRNEFPDFKTVLNTILKDDTHSINIRLDNIKFSKAEDADAVTITYPGEIGLNHELTLALDYLTYGSSFDGPDGSTELEDVPLEIDEVNLFFDVENSSPVGLALEIWLSPDPIDHENPASNPKAVKNTLAIAAGTEKAPAKERFVLTFDPDKFTNLIEAKTVYHLIKFTNQTETYDPIAADDYLAITAWADITCTINKH
ncbi:MAG: hypothetical protein GX081_08725 [Firmicutes bacterium]|nr:hypothetical protein [Bacillota bacterium]